MGFMPGRAKRERGELAALVADNIRLICARRHISQVELAQVLQVSKMTVSDRFRYVSPWTLDDLDVLADFFGVPVGVLLGASLDVNGETRPGAGAGPLLVPGKRTVRGEGRLAPGPVGQPLPLGAGLSASA